MNVIRWQAPVLPTKAQMKMLLTAEGLDITEEVLEPSMKINDHRHPFTEIRMVVQGEMLFNISGNQFLLRPGDRVEVPANTKHSHTAQGTESCVCIYAQRVF